jgi:hypothetical protein
MMRTCWIFFMRDMFNSYGETSTVPLEGCSCGSITGY